MNSNMKKFVILPAMALFFTASFAVAEEQDSIVVQQKSLIEKLDSLMNLVSELIIAKNTIVSAANSSDSSTQALNEQVEYLESVTTNLHEAVMKVRMVPIERAVQKFPRMVRDLEKKLDKKMQLTITGEETELDRTVVDEIGDPLMHLIRNSADHGIESADLRAQRGKPEVGQIFLHAFQDVPPPQGTHGKKMAENDVGEHHTGGHGIVPGVVDEGIGI